MDTSNLPQVKEQKAVAPTCEICYGEYNEVLEAKFLNMLRVAKTCQPCQPVGANFSRSVLIFGQSTRKNCAIMSNAHITCTIAHRANSSQNCTTNTIVVSTGATRGRKTPSAPRHCRPESFCASGKFLRVSTKFTLKSSQNIV